MGTGFRATFVISWSQTEVDGLRAAPVEALGTGVTWRWTGHAVRVDGAAEVLLLDGAEGMAELRARAARMVRRLVGTAMGGLPADGDEGAEWPDFTLTDGRRSYGATLIEVPGAGARLLMFLGEMPPAEVDLWVIRSGLAARPPQPAPQAGVICFTPGTLIRLDRGVAPIETLRPGDRLLTKDNGPQEVLWTGHRRMSGARLYAMPHLRPVRVGHGALGCGRPEAALTVSPRHRLLVQGAAARALFNEAEVLVAAEDLVGGVGVSVDLAAREVTYVHVLLERHEIVWANGVETESFHPGLAALDLLEATQRLQLYAVMPDLEVDPESYGDFARRNLSAAEAAILRHDLAA